MATEKNIFVNDFIANKIEKTVTTLIFISGNGTKIPTFWKQEIGR